MIRQMGFEGWQKISLKKVIVEDKISWIKSDEINGNDKLRFCL